MTTRIPATMTAEELLYEVRYITEVMNVAFDTGMDYDRAAHLSRHDALWAEYLTR